MDKLIVVQVLEGIDVEYGKRGFEVHGQLRGALRAAITALTQDRAAVLEEALTGAIAFVRDTTDYRCGNPAFEQMEAKLVRALKTPPAQAEPKLYERRYSTGDLAMRSPDTRNPAEADRRKSARGGGWGSPARRKINEGVNNTGRRAGDRARWVEDKVCPHCHGTGKAGMELNPTIGCGDCNSTGRVPTPPSQPAACDHQNWERGNDPRAYCLDCHQYFDRPPTQPAAEVSSSWVDWHTKYENFNMGAPSVYALCKELDKRERGS